MTHLEFTVHGRPQPAGSKKGFVNPRTSRVVIVDDAKNSRPWKQQVAGAALDAMGDTPMLNGPVELAVTFFLARPKGHYGTGRNADALKPSAPEHPTVKPDTTKLLRAVEDAMTGIVWRDDAQVVTQRAYKVYGATDHCTIRVWDLATDHQVQAVRSAA